MESITQINGPGIPVRGNDIDTDRIIPARYLAKITFEGLGEFAFEDDRKSRKGHPFDNPAYQGASVLAANANFGCGSSREHAPQALMKWGIHGIVAESFAEIFQGNCTAMGIPCVTASPEDIQTLMNGIETDPSKEIHVDLKTRMLTFGDLEIPIEIPNSNRLQLVEGAWDATGMLLEASDETRRIADRLPYVSGFES